MNRRDSASGTFGALVVWLAAGSAVQAQCAPEWDVAAGTPGISGGYAAPLRAWNDGSGEKLFVGGSFSAAGGNGANRYLARWDKATGTWSSLGSGISGGFTNAFMTQLLPWNPGTGERLIAAGWFDTAGAVANTASLAMWSGTGWESMGTNWTGTTRGSIWSLAVFEDRLYVGGGVVNSQPSPAPPGTGYPIGGVAWQGMASWNGQPGGWQSHVSSLTGANTNIFALCVFDDGSGPALFAAGRFSAVNSVAGTSLIAKWDGESWSSVGGGLTPSSSTGALEAMTVFNDGTGPALYVAGSQFSRSGVGPCHVAKWNGTAWAAVGGVIGTGRLTSMTTFDDGDGEKLYVGGTAMLPIQYIARWEGGQWVTVGGGIPTPITPPFPSVFGLGEWDGKMYVAGNFLQIGTAPLATSGLAAWTSCSAECYANCDGSTIAPVANVSDFICFLNRYGAGDSYANCDGSTIAPVLNVNDFTCFLNQYAIGCP